MKRELEPNQIVVLPVPGGWQIFQVKSVSHVYHDKSNAYRRWRQMKGQEMLTHEQVKAWSDSMLNEATDDMQEKSMDITPFTLSAFFVEHYQLPFTPEEAKEWLDKQEWYTK